MKTIPFKDFWTPVCPLCTLPLTEAGGLDPFTEEILILQYNCKNCSYNTLISIDLAFNKDNFLNMLLEEEEKPTTTKR